jgi:Uncharacterized conserved protein
MLKKQFSKSKPVCKVTFSLPKQAVNGGKEVKLLGEFNNWNPEEGIMLKSSKSEFKTVIELETGREYQFRYLIDNSVWENDWAADYYLPTPYGVENSVVTLPTSTVAKAKKTTTKKVTAKKTATKKTTKADDLKKIEGIGPKIAGLLKAANIVTFADLSVAKVTTLKAVLKEAGSRYTMHDPTTWPKQAKLAANGKWDALKKLQDELNGGKA